jgi:hypothetical protein
MKAIPGISRGKIVKPALVIVYGPDGVGKSTFGAEAPNPIFLGPEDGSSNLDVARFDDNTTFQKVKANVRRLIAEDLGFQTLVIDSLDWLEPLVWKETCARDPKHAAHIEDVGGGFQKGYIYALDIWKELMNELNELRAKKQMNIILIAHSLVKVFNDPSQPAPYDRYQLKLHDKAAALWREYVDCVLFANFEVVTKKENQRDKKAKAYGDDKRIMYSQRRPSFDAKNRYGLPFELPLGWIHFHSARAAGSPDSLESVMADIESLINDPKLASKQLAMAGAITKAQGNLEELMKIRNYARVLAGDE